MKFNPDVPIQKLVQAVEVAHRGNFLARLLVTLGKVTEAKRLIAKAALQKAPGVQSVDETKPEGSLSVAFKAGGATTLRQLSQAATAAGVVLQAVRTNKVAEDKDREGILRNAQELKELFNKSVGKVRVVMLVSPT